MDRRYFIQTLSLVAAGHGLASWVVARETASRRQRESKPSVLFIGVDDLRMELACFGDTRVLTPNLDRLTQRGLRFSRAYCQQALCNPSRASLMTGLRPDTLGISDLHTHFRETHPDVVTLPQVFKQHGYHTQNIGKIFHNWRQDAFKGDAPSWSVPAILHYASHYEDKPVVAGELPPDLSTLEKTECRDVPDEAYYDGRVAAAAVEALHRIKGKPFFLAVGFWKPHLPFNAPKRYWDLYDHDQIDLPPNPDPPVDVPPLALQNYRIDSKETLTDDDVRELRHGHYAAISYLDAQIGKVLDELDRLRLRENTIVVFWSDHGLHVGEHGLWGKTTNFELDARAPLIIADPRHPSTAGRETRSLVELLDLYPTLMDLCRLPAPHRLEGVSLKPLLEDPSTTVKTAAFTQHPRPPYRVKGEPPETMGYSMRTDRYRYTEWRKVPGGDVLARELYDHDKDPRETVNLATRAQHAATVEKLAAQMASLLD
jgi:iduronate 2-sulfatase